MFFLASENPENREGGNVEYFKTKSVCIDG